MSVIYSNSFAVDDLATNWTVVTGTWAVTGGVLRLSAGATPRLIRTNSTAYASVADMRVTVKRVAGTTFDGGPTVRHQSGADTCYYLDATGTNAVDVFRRVAGVDSATLGTRTVAHANGDTLGLEVSGTGATVTLKVYVNGVQQGADILDTNAARIVAAGWGGLLVWSNASNYDFDDFSVDNLAAGTTLEQEGFRFRNDDGSETTATWAGAQDANVTAPVGTYRLRTIVNATGDVPASAFQLEARVNGGAWRRVRPG